MCIPSQVLQFMQISQQTLNGGYFKLPAGNVHDMSVYYVHKHISCMREKDIEL